MIDTLDRPFVAQPRNHHRQWLMPSLAYRRPPVGKNTRPSPKDSHE